MTNKYIWFQGRQTYTYALLYNHIEKRRDWLDKARHGFRFLADKAYAGGGRWNYKLDRQGHVLVGTTSVFADMHVLQARGIQHGPGRQDAEAMAISACPYDTLGGIFSRQIFQGISWRRTPGRKTIWHDMAHDGAERDHDMHPVLGEGSIRGTFIDECLDKI